MIWTSVTGMRRINNEADGFTLAELLVVLVIMVIMALTAVPSFVGFHAETRLRSATRAVVSVLSYARSKSVTQRRAISVQFNLEEGYFGVMVEPATESRENGDDGLSLTDGELESLIFDRREHVDPATFIEDESTLGRRRSPAAGVILTSVTDTESGDLIEAIIFDPAGGATTAEIVLENERGARRIVSVDGLTGRLRIVDENTQ